MQLGASGYVLKDPVDEEIETAVRTIRKGSRYFGMAVTDAAGDSGSELALP